MGLGLPEVIVEHDGGEVTRYLHLPHGIATDDGVWSYGAADGLGSVRQRLDTTGQILSASSYRPFGSPLSGDGGDPYGYAGEWWEDSAGLLFLRARYYQPELGRFISRDTWGGFAGVPQSQNRYSYVRNNPIRWVDSSGHTPMAPNPSSCEEPQCFIFYFAGTEKTGSDYWNWKHGEPLFIEKLRKLSTALYIVFPFGVGSGYEPEHIRDLQNRPGLGGICGELLGGRDDIQEQQVLDVWRGTADWLFETKANEVAATLRFFQGIDADSPDMEIDFVAHSGGAHYAVGAAQSLSRYGLKVDNVVSLGGLFKVNDFRTHGLDNIGHLYDNISEYPGELVRPLRGPSCTGFDAYHGKRTWALDVHPKLWELDKVTKLDAGISHSSYFTDAGVWSHLSTKTVRLCEQVRLHRLLRDGWSEVRNW